MLCLLIASAALAQDGPDAAGLQHDCDGDGPLAEVVPLPPAKHAKSTAGVTKGVAAAPAGELSRAREQADPAGRLAPPILTVAAQKGEASAGKIQPATARPPMALSTFLPREPGYTLVLSGVLDANLELGPEQSPVLVRGSLAVPEGLTLRIKAGACIHLRACGDTIPISKQPEIGSCPRPSPSAALCVWGTLLAEGVTGNPIEIINQEKVPAALLLYSSAHNKLEGVRLKDIGVTQAAGICSWTNCEFTGAPHYALAAGAALFTHCSFRNCGGIFATYNLGPWSLLARRNLFDGHREGIVLGGNPGEARLVIEKNNFASTRGAHIRVMPAANTAGRGHVPARGREEHGTAGQPQTEAARNPQGDLEILIGENWYGSALPEEAELRLVDRRTDPAVHARLNTRPPAERPYAHTGAGVSAAVLAATLREQQAVQQKLLQAHAAPPPKTEDPPEPAVMSRAVSKTR